MKTTEGEPMFRIASLDIECTALDATYGRLLCACIKFADEDEPRTVLARRYKDEPKALETIIGWWNEADIIVHWNGKLFDVPFINARLMIRRKELSTRALRKSPILHPDKKQIDGRWINSKLRTRGNRLDGAAKDLGLANQKYDVRGEAWIKAADGHKESLDLIVKHCQKDVMITEEIMVILKPYIVRVNR